jgi:methionine-rich copper-binding protein CopC
MKMRIPFLAGLLVVLTIQNLPSASAHAALGKTIPSKGSVVSKNTNQVSLFFGEDLLTLADKNPNSISVLDSHAKLVSNTSTTVSGSKISTALATPLKSGRYTVKYRVVSADGHVVSGTYTFTVK